MENIVKKLEEQVTFLNKKYLN